MWNPSAAGLIALRAAANILKAKLDQMIVRMIDPRVTATPARPMAPTLRSRAALRPASRRHRRPRSRRPMPLLSQNPFVPSRGRRSAACIIERRRPITWRTSMTSRSKRMIGSCTRWDARDCAASRANSESRCGRSGPAITSGRGGDRMRYPTNGMHPAGSVRTNCRHPKCSGTIGRRCT